MRLRTRLRRLVLPLVTALAPALLLAGPASATTYQICGNGGSGYCLNDWGGHAYAGDAIKMYYGNSSNENFYIVRLTNFCSGAGYVTSAPSCYGQFGAGGINLVGDYVVEIQYGPAGCVASDPGSGLAILGTCPDLSGNNGSDGTVFAEAFTGPLGSKQWAYYDRYWSKIDNDLRCLESGGNIGVQAYENHPNGCTVWGGSGTDSP